MGCHTAHQSSTSQSMPWPACPCVRYNRHAQNSIEGRTHITVKMRANLGIGTDRSIVDIEPIHPFGSCRSKHWLLSGWSCFHINCNVVHSCLDYLVTLYYSNHCQQTWSAAHIRNVPYNTIWSFLKGLLPACSYIHTWMDSFELFSKPYMASASGQIFFLVHWLGVKFVWWARCKESPVDDIIHISWIISLLKLICTSHDLQSLAKLPSPIWHE